MAKYDVAAYIWPSYTGDEKRSRIFWPEGYGEWQTVKAANAKFEGHLWPRKPLWGYVNEADPCVMQMQIDAALSHGVNTFIYDWYWYDGRPFLENCLDDGFLQAKNNEDMQFYLMWANHDATYLWDKRNNSTDMETVVWHGWQNKEEFVKVIHRMQEKYFWRRNYYKIDGKPVLMIYDVANLVKGLGGIEEAKKALAWCVEQGIHLQFTYWFDSLNIDGLYQKDFAQLGFSSCSHYQFVSFADIEKPYPDVAEDVQKVWEDMHKTLSVTYFPHVSLGWDNNPRFTKFNPGVLRAKPEEFEQALRNAKRYCDSHPDQPKLITINSWNEWTEGSYLEPDDLYGYGYLEAVKKVFGACV